MKLNKLQQLLVGLAVILLAVVLAQFVFLKNDKQAIEATKQRNEKLRQDISIAEKIATTANELRQQMDDLKAQLDRLKKILPLEINKPKFMADIKRYANENGIEILYLSQNKPHVDDVIVEHPFTYGARGKYHDFGNFFAQLSNYPRILNVKALFIERKTDKPGYLVEGSFIISVFTYKEPTEAELQAQMEAKKKERTN